MPELKFCGCILMKETLWLRKEMMDKNGKYIETVEMTHDYYHLVDKTGDNTKKVELFNKGEQLRLNMTKRTFNVLVDEKVYDVDDDENQKRTDDIMKDLVETIKDIREDKNFKEGFGEGRKLMT